MDIVLASSSPRRQQLIKEIVDSFTVCPSNINEDISYSSPIELVERLSFLKASQVSKENTGSIVIGADTIVVFDGNVLNKPIDYNEAYSMLSNLSGNWHSVYTGVSLLYSDKYLVFTEHTKVKFRNLSKDEIDAYINSGACYDKAGAYGIQDNDFVEQTIGSYTNVMGLPIEQLAVKLKEFRINISK